jgi:hypothetical protein
MQCYSPKPPGLRTIGSHEEGMMDRGEKTGKIKSSQLSRTATDVSGAAATYADGTPFDRVQHLEAKLILKPDGFTSVKSFRDFGRIVRRTAKQVGVGFIEDKEADPRPEIREIVFLDTPDFALYTNAFILRRRVSYVDGFSVGDPEIVFKFRHPDERKAAALDVRPRIDGQYRIKFKAEALPLKDEIGGYRILYSHNCQFGLSQTHAQDRTSIATLEKIFPPLAMLKRPDKERVNLVNEGVVEEVLLPLGNLDFGKELVAKCDVAVWRTRGDHLPLVGEFAFQVKFDRREDIAAKQKKLAAQLYITLQREAAGWLTLGVTKTAMVHRLKGAAPQSHE